MLNIAICDDEPLELEKVTTYLQEFIEINQIDATIRCFSHPDSLLIACKTDHFSLYLLDIIMPMVNGIELGQKIRCLDREAQIIFTTNEPSFALDAYSTNPINYLLKPIHKKLFFDTLSLAISKISSSKATTLTIRTKDGVQVVSLFSIICCEYINHIVKYTFVGDKTITSRTLRENFTSHLAPLMNDRRFLQPHNAFVINMSRVQSFTKNGFIMQDDIFVPISSKQYASVRDSFLDFLLLEDKTL